MQRDLAAPLIPSRPARGFLNERRVFSFLGEGGVTVQVNTFTRASDNGVAALERGAKPLSLNG